MAETVPAAVASDRYQGINQTTETMTLRDTPGNVMTILLRSSLRNLDKNSSDRGPSMHSFLSGARWILFHPHLSPGLTLSSPSLGRILFCLFLLGSLAALGLCNSLPEPKQSRWLTSTSVVLNSFLAKTQGSSFNMLVLFAINIHMFERLSSQNHPINA